MITIDLDKLNKLKEAKDFTSNREVETSLLSLLEAKKQVDTVYDEVRDALKQSVQKQGLQFLEGESVKVTLSQSGSRYELVSPQACPPEVLEVKLNPKAVDAYLENNNKLPDGVEELETINTSIRISVK